MNKDNNTIKNIAKNINKDINMKIAENDNRNINKNKKDNHTRNKKNKKMNIRSQFHLLMQGAFITDSDMKQNDFFASKIHDNGEEYGFSSDDDIIEITENIVENSTDNENIVSYQNQL